MGKELQLLLMGVLRMGMQVHEHGQTAAALQLSTQSHLLPAWDPSHKETQSWATVIRGGTPLTWEVVPDSHLFPALSSRRLWKAVQEAAKHCSLLHIPTLEFFFAGRNILNIANRNDKDSATGEEQQSVHYRQPRK